MPKSHPHNGLIAVGGGGVSARLQERHGRKQDPVTRARSNERGVRGAIEKRPELAVWVGSRLYVRDDEDVLDALAEALGLDLPAAVKPAYTKAASKKPVPAKAVAVKPARTKRATSPSSREAAAT